MVIHDVMALGLGLGVVVEHSRVADRDHAHGQRARDVRPAQVAHVRSAHRLHPEAGQRVTEDHRRRLVRAHLVGERPVVEQVEQAVTGEVLSQDGRPGHAHVADDAEAQARVLQGVETVGDALGDEQLGLVAGLGEGGDQLLAQLGRHVEAELLDDGLGCLHGPVLLARLPLLDVRLPGRLEHRVEPLALAGEPGVLEEAGPGVEPPAAEVALGLVEEGVPEVEGDGIQLGHAQSMPGGRRPLRSL